MKPRDLKLVLKKHMYIRGASKCRKKSIDTYAKFQAAKQKQENREGEEKARCARLKGETEA